jgi:hypothetical protein
LVVVALAPQTPAPSPPEPLQTPRLPIAALEARGVGVKSLTNGIVDWTREWVTGWLIGAAMSLLVLAVFGARVYLITRGQPIRSPKLVRIERLFLAAMLVLCGWPHLPWVADTFSLWGLALHVLAPVVAATVVAGLPMILTNRWTADGLDERL